MVFPACPFFAHVPQVESGASKGGVQRVKRAVAREAGNHARSAPVHGLQKRIATPKKEDAMRTTKWESIEPATRGFRFVALALSSILALTTIACSSAGTRETSSSVASALEQGTASGANETGSIQIARGEGDRLT